MLTLKEILIIKIRLNFILTGMLIFTLAFISCSDLLTSPGEETEKDEFITENVLEKGVNSLLTMTDGFSEGTYINGVNGLEALYQISIPETWNGDVVLYAHGFIPPQEPLRIQDDEIGGEKVSSIVNTMGFAFATTSYATNGLIPPEVGITDLDSVVNIFNRIVEKFYPEATINHIYLAGASEGGWLTTLAVERRPDLFSGGLSLCGPVGDFQKQLNYLGDFRVVFDYFFKNKIKDWTKWTQRSPGIPQEIIDNWTTVYKPAIEAAIIDYPYRTKQLLKVTRVPVEYDSPLAPIAVTSILRYNITTINDIIDNKLGGVPYRNLRKWYSGSYNDFRLNRRIERFRGDRSALSKIRSQYQSSGDLSIPIVMTHTTRDEIVPYWHEPLYRAKVFMNGSGLYHTNFPVTRYGHCNFEQEEVLRAFQWLIFKVTARDKLLAAKSY
jgi:pimeloyl-ACP methyl ester carboxylesterase